MSAEGVEYFMHHLDKLVDEACQKHNLTRVEITGALEYYKMCLHVELCREDTNDEENGDEEDDYNNGFLGEDLEFN